jgi:hypothetical protein
MKCRLTFTILRHKRLVTEQLLTLPLVPFSNLLTAALKKKSFCIIVSDLAASYGTDTKPINQALEDARSGNSDHQRDLEFLRSLCLKFPCFKDTSLPLHPTFCRSNRVTCVNHRWYQPEPLERIRSMGGHGGNLRLGGRRVGSQIFSPRSCCLTAVGTP